MNRQNIGWLNGLIGVVIFAASLPATRIAVQGFSPEFLTVARATIAAVLGLFCLLFSYKFQLKYPSIPQIKSLSLVALGVVLGFPLFTALALQSIPSSRAIVFVGLLPLSTAIFGVFRAHEKPSIQFWLFALLGSSFVLIFMFSQSTTQDVAIGDAYMLVAIILCGLGYAEGGYLSRELGSWQVICWALILTFPIMAPLTIYYFPQSLTGIKATEFLALFYVAIFSMLIGFFFWYKGLALGGIAKIGQIQLLQPLIGLMLSAFLLGEQVTMSMLMVSCLVFICVLLAKKYA